MSTNYMFSPAELKIRKYWAVWLLTATILCSGLLLFGVSVAFIKDSAASILLGSISLLEIIFSYTLYYCACKKLGTAYLSFSIVGAVAFLVIEHVELFMKGYSMQGLINELISDGISIAWIFLCYKMRKINTRIQEQNVTCDESYPQLVKWLEDASTEEELAARFNSIVEGRTPHYVHLLAEICKQKKSNLKTHSV